MNFAYIRISTDKVTIDNQRRDIIKLATEKKIEIDEWVEESISRTEKIDDRELGKLQNRLNSKDTIVISELSRIGQNLTEIMNFIDDCIEQNIKVYTCKEKYEC